MDTDISNYGAMLLTLNVASETTETYFAASLELFLGGDRSVNSILDVVARFRAFCASKALQILEDDLDDDDAFTDWNLETKLWDLVHVLWLCRLDQLLPALLRSSPGEELSTLALRELLIIIVWLQRNTELPASTSGSAIDNDEDQKVIRESVLDGDSFLANSSWVGSIPEDTPGATSISHFPRPQSKNEKDASSSNIYQTVYRLLLCRKLNEAVAAAQDSGKYALALILLGASQDFSESDENSRLEILPASLPRFKHNSLWRNTVHTLSKQTGLDRYERLIYNYLSGGDISENLDEASHNWEQALLLYLNQLYLSSLQACVASSDPSDQLDGYQIRSVPSIQDALDEILQPGCPTAVESAHPLRIISASVMLGLEPSLIDTFIRSISENDANELNSPRTLRVITHIAILQSVLGDTIPCADLAASIALYSAHLVNKNAADAMPIYLAFIPDRLVFQETYSMFLATMTDQSQRAKQLSAARRVASILDSYDVDLQNLHMLENVLRMTVAHVVEETTAYYSQTIPTQDDLSEDDPTDYRLYRAVQWFYDNNMWEDAILATITVIRRFLLNFKLESFMKFAKSSDWRNLISQYDSDIVLRSVASEELSFESNQLVSEADREEILEYVSLASALDVLSQWQILGESADHTATSALAIIYKWLMKPIEITGAEVLIEIRSNYVPFFIIELMGVRDKNSCPNGSLSPAARQLIFDVANDDEFDLLPCLDRAGKLDEFLHKAAEVSLSAYEK